MTEKLFWIDSYRTEFVAKVQQEFPVDAGTAIVLDRTCFYATSGGQPCDHGTINGVAIRDVRIEGSQLLHIADSPVREVSVVGVIDWPRRFDHMQQHTGQHILSAAFFRLFGAETSSFHLGSDYCSIELNQPKLTERQMEQAEQLANEIVSSDTEISVLSVKPEEAEQYALRKKSDLAEALRIIRIGDFDLSPCSGTHVRKASEVGLIFVSGSEKMSQSIKIFFLCGNRIRRTYRQDLAVLKSLSKSLTTSFELLPESLTRLQTQVKDLRKEVIRLKEQQLEEEARQLCEDAAQSGRPWIVQMWARPYQEVRFLAQRLSECENIAGALISSEEHRVVFFKSRSIPLDLKAIFQSFLSRASAKGGGPPHFMEAGGFEVHPGLEIQLLDLFDNQEK